MTHRLRGLCAALLLLLLTVGVPVLLVAIGSGPLDVVGAPVWRRLLAPDDGTLIPTVVGVAAWAAWAVLTVLVVIEVAGAVRGIEAPRVPGLRVPQGAVRNLVAVAGLLFAGTPLAAQAAPAPAVVSIAELPPLLSAPLVPSTAPASVPSGGTNVATSTGAVPPATTLPLLPPAAPTSTPTTPGSVTYTVMRGDSLWDIAKTHLGDPLRFPEIIALNGAVLGADPDFLLPGTVLALPSNDVPPPPTGGTYVVEPGDTLSQIAADELGSAARYPEIFEASRDTVQPGGDTLTDPDLIHPGDVLTIPDGGTSTPSPDVVRTPSAEPASRPPADVPKPEAPAAQPGTERAPIDPSPAAPEASTPTTTAAANHSAAATPVDDERDLPAWALPGLTGTGSLLAGALLVAVRARRRTQARLREPGQMLAPPPPGLRGIERTITVVGQDSAGRLRALDAVLRSLGAARPRPTLDGVELTPTGVVLHLTDDDELPAPWAGGGRRWVRNLPDGEPDRSPAAPYPMLVTLGADRDGHLWLADLERLGTLAVSGDAAQAMSLARSLVAELAMNPWAGRVIVHTIGLGDALTALDPARVRSHDSAGTLGELDAALDASDAVAVEHEPDELHAVIAAAGLDSATVEKLAGGVAAHPRRPGVALVVVGNDGLDHASHATITAEGVLTIPSRGLTLTASGLTQSEAEASAALVAAAEDAACVPIPPATEAPDPVGHLVDAAGALRAEHTESRPLTGAAGPASFLAGTAADYAAVATTTDLATLAPIVPASTRADVEAATSTVDDDLTDWLQGEECSRPRLMLLGPIAAFGKGQVGAVAKRRPYFTAILGYLALHPNGATAQDLEQFGGHDKFRTNVGLVRTWMGKNPRTGVPYIPDARKTRAAHLADEPRYQVDDLLIDWDLFRRLRARGEARGTDGIDDLICALDLVTGRPFSNGHRTAWAWLDATDRPDLIAPQAIADVAHLVITNALAQGDVTLARLALRQALLAEADGDVTVLDHAAVLDAEGEHSAADQLRRERLIDWTEDDRPPIELPSRTAALIDATDRRRAAKGGPR